MPFTPASYTLNTADNDRKRLGVTASLQWQSANERALATLEHINSRASLEWREYVVASGDRGFLPYAPNAIQWFDESSAGRPLTVDANGYLTSGVGRSNEPNLPLQFRSRYNYNESNVKDTSLNFEYSPGRIFSEVSAGVYFSEKELIVRNTEYEGWQALGTPWNAQASYNASPRVVPELYERISFADHYNGRSVLGQYNSFLFPRMDLAENYAQTLREACDKWIARGAAQDGSGRCALPYEDLDDRAFSALCVASY